VNVIFAETIATTPAISWATREFECDAGIVITASHNPPEYNGFKIKANFGGPASPDMISAVEAEMDRIQDRPPLQQSFEELRSQGRIDVVDVETDYENMLRTRLDLAAIIKSGIRIAHDAMFGASQGVVARLLGPERVLQLRSDLNPGFHGQAPEPLERNLQDLAQIVVEEGYEVGLANDGDADRIGLFDETGQFVDSHQMLALLVKYLHEERGLTGEIVKTFSTTHMLDEMGRKYGLKVETTPIGFKYIGQKIVEGDVLVGGEESGGMAVKGHIPERDGIYIGLLIVEMMTVRGKKLSELVQELFDEFGPHYDRRADVHTTEEKKQRVLDRLKSGGLSEIAGRPVREVKTLDGYKHLTDDGWLLVRPSGTEPVLRIYAESSSAEQAEAIIRDALEQLGVADGVH
ncbi:MAG TPA: phosphoglucomutase/phosphomannomutase family protein, partial [Rhodothermales bacterium]|nr:phosphoglucomutase/phosphomannomutase family protein [Rhodothermales bacterium]